jgi:hypothetical protein
MCMNVQGLGRYLAYVLCVCKDEGQGKVVHP